jgi:pyrroloquinoline-quinone synthase
MISDPMASPTSSPAPLVGGGTSLLPPVTADDAVRRAVEGRELLSHPFYQRWQAGQLAQGELADYAVQYRCFEAALPAVLTAVAHQFRSEGATAPADSVQGNLADEMGCPEPHLDLFDRFAEAVGSNGTATPGPAADALVATYFDLVAEGPICALAGLAAYESQASAIASSKADGLRRWYELDTGGTAFWDVHATMDADHAEWATDALDQAVADLAEVERAARRAADAWWALLDEREAASPSSVELCSHH